MAKDYARRYRAQTKKGKKTGGRGVSRSLFVIFVLLLVIAAGVAGYYHYRQTNSASAGANLLPPVENATKTPIKAPQAPKEDPVDYQFYTLLPTTSVPDPQQDVSPPGEQPGYWLQLMVYYNMRDASAYLDRLQLMGLDALIAQRKSTKTDHDLYVVVLGPFPTKEDAVARQKDLQKSHISSYIYHVDEPAPVEDAAPEALEKT